MATTGLLDAIQAKPREREPRPVSLVTEDLKRIADNVDLMYRSERPDNPLALHDALHALHRAIVALDEIAAENRVQPLM